MSPPKKKQKTQKKTGDKDYIPATATNRKDCVLVVVEGDSALNACRAGMAGLSHLGALGTQGTFPNLIEDPSNQNGVRVQRFVQVTNLKIGKVYNSDSAKNSIFFGRIVLLGDGDLDGGHWNTLVLAAIQTLWPSLIENGMVFIAKPPEQRRNFLYLKPV